MAKRNDRERRREEYIRNNIGDDAEGISFDLLDEATVNRLREQGDIELPRRRVDVPADEAWNTRQMASRLLRGIENGDDIRTIAQSLTDVIGNNRASAMRNARTMFTGAENAGRLDSYSELESRGVVQKKVWISTPDDRTREEHLAMDGEEVDIDKEFSNGCQYPGDPSGDPSTVYNCRCSMRDHIVGFMREDGSISYVDYGRDRTLHDEQIEGERNRREEEENPPYRTADTRREAYSILRNDLHVTDIEGTNNIRKIEEELWVENVNRLSELNSRFNAIPEDGITLRVRKTSEEIASVGYTDIRDNSRTTSLNLSIDYFESPQFRENQIYYSNSELRWNMPVSEEYAGVYSITHGYGHMLQNSITFDDEYRNAISSLPMNKREEYASDTVGAIRASQREEILNIARENNPDFDLTSNISNYGMANDAEFFAECFANAMCGNPNELGEAMNEWLRRRGL